MNDRMGELFTVSYYKRASVGSNEITRRQVQKNSAKGDIFPNMGSNYIAEFTIQRHCG